MGMRTQEEIDDLGNRAVAILDGAAGEVSFVFANGVHATIQWLMGVVEDDPVGPVEE